VKPTAVSEPLFQLQLFRFETDKKLAFRIVGYSDCVGVESNNLPLRRDRALNVFKLLGSSARSRVMAVTAAPPATFLTDNSTVAARANTRAVVIEVFINGSAII
jgi:outer membrane protein OmpA-like peptidoglycan-associated protein